MDLLVWACGGRHHDGNLVQLDPAPSRRIVQEEEQGDEQGDYYGFNG